MDEKFLFSIEGRDFYRGECGAVRSREAEGTYGAHDPNGRALDSVTVSERERLYKVELKIRKVSQSHLYCCVYLLVEAPDASRKLIGGQCEMHGANGEFDEVIDIPTWEGSLALLARAVLLFSWEDSTIISVHHHPSFETLKSKGIEDTWWDPRSMKYI